MMVPYLPSTTSRRFGSACRSVLWLLSFLLAANPSGLLAATPQDAGVEFFEKKIRPVLVKHCYGCHSRKSKKVRGGLLLDTRAGIRTGGDSGPAVVPQKVADSPLIEALRYEGLKMPPKGRLPKSVVDDFEKWIWMGAPDPRKKDDGEGMQDENKKVQPSKHWSFQPLVRATAPIVKNADWPRSDVDRFVLARLEKRGLLPVADAGRRTLLRRVTFDLIGLPPTPEELQAFLADGSEHAFTAVVDRLLSSPRFGEHWGRHWLDVARYADSNGGDINLTFHNAWRYRDYVIAALNADKPFNQFIVEQLAGDLLPSKTGEQRAEQLIATGFLVVGTKMLSERDKEKLHMDVVDEQLDSIGRAFLGLTLGCARCHDHKFDPIPTRDYYALAGILRSTVTVEGIRMGNVNVSGWIERRLPMKPEHEQALAKFEKQAGALSKQIAAANSAFKKLKSQTTPSADSLVGVVVDDTQAEMVGIWKKSVHVSRYVGAGYVHDDKQGKGKKSITFRPDLPKAGDYEVRISYAGGKGRETKVPVTVRFAGGQETVHVNQQEIPPIGLLFRSLGRFRFDAGKNGSVTISTEGTTTHVIADAAQFIPVELLGKEQPGTSQAAAASLQVAGRKQQQIKRLERELAELKKHAPPPAPMTMAARDREQPADCRIRIRGEPRNVGKTVPRGFLTLTPTGSQPQVNTKQSGRLELAHWIASRENPLTARVIVNRIWHHLFGAGLVRSVDNFGKLGERPSHPQLLDRLAVEFVEEGWSIKQTVRTIVLSRTYQLGSGFDQKGAAVDPQNRLLWRHNRRRLTAESIRDAILSASGSLDTQAGGSAVTGLGETAIANNLKQKTGYLALNEQVRRSVYLPLIRNNLPDMLTIFDLADPDVVVGRRSVTTVPAQALFMMNSRFVKQHAKKLAQRVLQAGLPDENRRLDLLYVLTTARRPTESERARAIKFVAGFEPLEPGDERKPSPAAMQAWTSFCQALLASTEFRFVD